MKVFTTVGLVLLLLLSTASFRLNTHHCGGRIIAWSLVGEARPCGNAPSERPICAKHAAGSMAPKGCCEDRSVVFPGLPVETIVDALLQLPPTVRVLITEDIQPLRAPMQPGHGWSLIAHFRPPPLSGWAIHLFEGSIRV